jgi:hypothetical protein
MNYTRLRNFRERASALLPKHTDVRPVLPAERFGKIPHPIQVGVYTFRGEDPFEQTFQRVITRTTAFMTTHVWLPSHVTRTATILEVVDTDTIAQTQSISLLPDRDHHSVVVYFNHEVLGGGDFLHFGVYVFGGNLATSASLLTEPGALASGAALLWSLYRNPLLYQRPVAKLSVDVFHPQVYKCRLDLTQFDRAIAARKFHVVAAITAFIFGGTGNSYSTDLLTWLPVAFQKSAKSRCNNIGIIPFLCGPQDTASTLQQLAWDHRHLALGSTILQNLIPTTLAVRASNYAKTRAQLVITMGQVNTQPHDQTTIPISDVTSGFPAAPMASTWKPYPFYCLVASFDNVAYITLTTHDTGFRPNSDLGLWKKTNSEIGLQKKAPPPYKSRL